MDHGGYIPDHGGYFLDHGGYIQDYGSYILDHGMILVATMFVHPKCATPPASTFTPLEPI
jgi:hypothetical protein